MKFRVLDTTQGTQIVPDVLKTDTAREPISVIAKNLNEILIYGMWLNPYRGIPNVAHLPDMGIVYVDTNFSVLTCLEGHRQQSIALRDVPASSALVLPPDRVSEARIQSGDKLEFRDLATGNLWGGYAARDQSASSKSIHDDVQSRQPQSKGLRRILGRLLDRNKMPKSFDRRKAERRAVPGLVAYFSLTRLRKRFEVGSISTEGFYVMTDERWAIGTSIMVGLEIVHPGSKQIEATISVQSKVIRLDEEGVGFAFDDDPAHRNRHLTVTSVEEWQQLQKFLQMIKR